MPHPHGDGKDLLGGGFSPVSEHAHLAGDDIEANALDSCARGFNRGVEGQQTGLVADLLDGGYEALDLVKAGVELRKICVTALYAFDEFFDEGGASRGELPTLRDQLSGLVNVRTGFLRSGPGL